tara:strand:+ start:2406 stop:2945 length:540 start_codon:yes stop_codon:yes gene_type:complete
MTVRVSKPEFNLREKLTELDYSTLPYDKIPPGGIVQSQVKYSNNTTYTTSLDGWVSLNTVGQVDYTMKITPRFLGSKLIFETDMTTMLNDDDGYVRYRLVDLNNPAGTTVFHANTYCGSAHYKVSTDDWIGYPVRAMGTVVHTGEHNLVLQARVKQGGTLSFSWSGSDYRIVRVTEIRQ